MNEKDGIRHIIGLRYDEYTDNMDVLVGATGFSREQKEAPTHLISKAIAYACVCVCVLPFCRALRPP